MTLSLSYQPVVPVSPSPSSSSPSTPTSPSSSPSTPTSPSSSSPSTPSPHRLADLRWSTAEVSMAETSDSSVRQRCFKKISVEGNIACGKSTLVKVLQKLRPNWHVVPEPLEKWQNVVGGQSGSMPAEMGAASNLLGLRLGDPKRWAYTFQTWVTLSRLQIALAASHPPERHTVYERSVYSNRYGSRPLAQPIGCLLSVPPLPPPPPAPGPWQDVGGNLLQMLYSDASRWAYTFQTLSAMGRIRAQLSVPPSAQPVQVLERSIYSDRYVFAASLHEQGSMNDTEWVVYQEWQGWLLSEFDKRVELDGMVYLRAEPEACLARMRVRNREEERGVGLEYLDTLHRRHEDWLVDRTTVVHHPCSSDTPVLVLDASQDFESNEELQAELINQIEDFLDKI
ncbi:unnamed protein product [Lampetra planeri]